MLDDTDPERLKRLARERQRERRARKREQNRLSKIRQRSRERKHIKVYRVRAGEFVHEALKARNEDAGLSAERAEREARNPNKVSADLTEVIKQWAVRYLRERHA